VALSTNQKIAIAVGATAAVVLFGAVVLAKPKELPKTVLTKPKEFPTPQGLNFETRNLDALNAVVDKMLADPNIAAGAVKAFADSLAYYGFIEQQQKLLKKAATLPKYTQQEIKSGAAALWEQQAKQGII
jgi:hypothetical protein